MPKQVVVAEKKEEEDGSKIEVAAQAFIRSSLLTIIEHLLMDLESEQEQMRFIDFSQRMYTLYSMRFARRTENLRSCFDRFCAETTPTLEDHFGGDLAAQPPNAIRADEDFFMELLHSTLSEGNFELLSDSYYQSACATDFEVAIEMKMNTHELDSSFIKRLHARHKDEHAFRTAASVTHSVLIYNRGMGQASTTGFFVLEKIDIILEWTFFAALNMLSSLLSSLLAMVNFASHFKRLTGFLSKSSDKNEDSDDDDGFVPEHDDDDGSSRTKRYVFRRTLKQAIRENPMNLFMPVELLEPTFRELVIVYRAKKELLEADRTKSIPRVVLKSFTDIPVADFEVVLPAQNPKSRPMDAFKIIIAVMGAVLTVRSQLTETKARLSTMETVTIMDIMVDLWPTLAVVAGYVVKIVMQYMSAQRKYNMIITSYLYQKSLCSNRGLLPFIVDSTLQQEVKEALIGYYFLWSNRARTFAELDDECEMFLAGLEEEVDFEADDAVRKLMFDDLVRCALPRTKDSQLYHLPSISRATQALQDKIMQFHEEKNRECPYCAYLHDVPHGH